MRHHPPRSKWASLRAGLGLPLLALALTACGEGLETPEGEELGSGEASVSNVRVRLMAANITSGQYQNYDLGHGIRIMQGTQPDVVMIQEFNYGDNSASTLRQFVDTTFGPSFSYYREGGASIPNGVISRWPIVASGEWDDPKVTNRDFAWARIDIPGPKDLWVVSVHLLTSDATTRNEEATSLVQYIQEHIPAGDYLSIAGDFNTSNRTESCFTTFSQVVSTSGAFPVDQNNNGGTNASRAKPYDHVLVDDDLKAYQTATVIGSSSYSAGLVVDTRVYTPLSDIYPAQYGDSGAPYMQHMAVIKDFLVPGDTGTGTDAGTTTPDAGTTIPDAGTGIIDAGTGTDAGTTPDAGTTTPDAGTTTPDAGTSTSQIIINEILANEPGSDINGEFVELVNVGSSAVDLSGWTVSDGVSVRHTFASGTSLSAGAAVAVFGGAAGIPVGLTNAVAASSGTLGLGNGGDTVTLKNASGASVNSYTYASSLSGTDAVSANRSPDVVGSSFALHTSLSSLLSSPGKRADGTPFSGSTGGGNTDAGTTTPDAGTTTPDAGTTTPDAGTTTPDAGTTTPDAGTTTPDAGTGTGIITAETESNDSAASANSRVARSIDVSGTISTSTDADWFAFTTDGAGTVTVKLTMPGTADLDWYLHSASNTSTYLARGYTTSNPEQGSYNVSQAGTYYVKVVGYAGAMSNYTLNVSGAVVTP